MGDYIGRAVSKLFPGYGTKPFPGKVASTTKIGGRKYYHIKYADGDREDVDEKELKKILLPPKTVKTTPIKRKTTAPKKSAPSPSTQEKELSPTPTPTPTLSQGAVEAANAYVASIVEPLDRSQVQPSPEVLKHGATALDQQMEMADFTAAAAAAQMQEEHEHDIPARDRISSPQLPRSTTTTTTVTTTPVQRHPFPERKKGAKEGLKASRAVAAGGMLHIGDVMSSADVPFDQLIGTNPIFYRKQAKRILKELGVVLEKAGAAPEDLLSASVKLKDSEVGFAPFCEAWNEWIGDVPPPTMSIGESYLGDPANLVAISAVAKLPSPYR